MPHRLYLLLKSRIGGGHLVVLCVALTSLVVVKLLVVLMTKNHPGSIRGEMQSLTGVMVTYGDTQAKSLSPVCGCVAELAAKEWRGITVVASKLRIERPQPHLGTAYMLTAAAPAPVSWTSTLFAFEFAAYSVSAPGIDFEAARLLQPVPPPEWKIEKLNSVGPVSWVQLMTISPVHVELHGNKPISAWIPKQDAPVHITYEKGIHVTSGWKAKLTEGRNACDEKGYDEIEFPVLDSLGPNVIYWVRSDDVVLMTSSGKIPLNLSTPSSHPGVIAIVVKAPPFASRLAIQDLDPTVRRAVEGVGDPSATVAAFNRTIGSLCRHSTSAVLEIDDPVAQGAAYSEVRGLIARDKREATQSLPTILNLNGQFIPGDTQFRDPPLPVIPGFGLFGAPKSMVLYGATGKLAIEDRFIGIDVPSTLEFHAIENFYVREGTVSLPYPPSEGIVKSTLTLDELGAEVAVNGKPQNIRVALYLQWVDRVIAYLAAIPVLLSLWQWNRSSKKVRS